METTMVTHGGDVGRRRGGDGDGGEDRGDEDENGSEDGDVSGKNMYGPISHLCRSIPCIGLEFQCVGRSTYRPISNLCRSETCTVPLFMCVGPQHVPSSCSYATVTNMYRPL